MTGGQKEKKSRKSKRNDSESSSPQSSSEDEKRRLPQGGACGLGESRESRQAKKTRGETRATSLGKRTPIKRLSALSFEDKKQPRPGRSRESESAEEIKRERKRTVLGMVSPYRGSGESSRNTRSVSSSAGKPLVVPLPQESPPKSSFFSGMVKCLSPKKKSPDRSSAIGSSSEGKKRHWSAPMERLVALKHKFMEKDANESESSSLHSSSDPSSFTSKQSCSSPSTSISIHSSRFTSPIISKRPSRSASPIIFKKSAGGAQSSSSSDLGVAQRSRNAPKNKQTPENSPLTAPSEHTPRGTSKKGSSARLERFHLPKEKSPDRSSGAEGSCDETAAPKLKPKKHVTGAKNKSLNQSLSKSATSSSASILSSKSSLRSNSKSSSSSGPNVLPLPPSGEGIIFLKCQPKDKRSQKLKDNTAASLNAMDYDTLEGTSGGPVRRKHNTEAASCYPMDYNPQEGTSRGPKRNESLRVPRKFDYTLGEHSKSDSSHSYDKELDTVRAYSDAEPPRSSNPLNPTSRSRSKPEYLQVPGEHRGVSSGTSGESLNSLPKLGKCTCGAGNGKYVTHSVLCAKRTSVSKRRKVRRYRR